MAGVIAWMLLKGLPSLAGIAGLPAGRAGVYAALAAVLALGLVAGLGRGVPRRWHGFGLLTAVFVAVLCAHVGDLRAGQEQAMTLLNLRSLFLALTLTVLIARQVRPGLLLGLMVGYVAVVQISSLGLSLAALAPGMMRLRSAERLAGIYAGSFTLGYTAAAAIGGLGIAYKYVQGRPLRLLVLLGIGAAVGNSFLAINRTSIAALVVLGAGWLLERLRGVERDRVPARLLRTGVAAGGIVLAFAMALLVMLRLAPDATNAYLDTWLFRLTALGESSGQSIRWLTIDAGMRMFEAHPLIGVGWDNAAHSSVRYGATFASTAHNAFVQAMAEGGILGLAYAIGLLMAVPGALWWRHRGVPGAGVFAGAWATMVAFNLIASNLHLEAHWDLLFIWLLATCAAPRGLTPGSAMPASGPRAAGPGFREHV